MRPNKLFAQAYDDDDDGHSEAASNPAPSLADSRFPSQPISARLSRQVRASRSRTIRRSIFSRSESRRDCQEIP